MENIEMVKTIFDSIEVNVTSNDICTLLGNKNIDVDAAGITTLFGSVIEVVYF